MAVGCRAARGGRRMALLAFAAVAAAFASQAGAASTASIGRSLLGHDFKKGEDIMLYANKVGPFQNPT